MSTDEIILDIAAVIHSGRKFNSDPVVLATIILDHLETMDLIRTE